MEANPTLVIHLMALMHMQYRKVYGCSSHLDAIALASLMGDRNTPIPPTRMYSVLGFGSRWAMNAWLEGYGVTPTSAPGRRPGSVIIPDEIWTDLSRSPVPACSDMIDAFEGFQRVADKLNGSCCSEAVLAGIQTLQDSCAAGQIRIENLVRSLDDANGTIDECQTTIVDFREEIRCLETQLSAFCEMSCVVGEPTSRVAGGHDDMCLRALRPSILP